MLISCWIFTILFLRGTVSLSSNLANVNTLGAPDDTAESGLYYSHLTRRKADDTTSKTDSETNDESAATTNTPNSEANDESAATTNTPNSETNDESAATTDTPNSDTNDEGKATTNTPNSEANDESVASTDSSNKISITTKKPVSNSANKGSKTTKKPVWKWKPAKNGSKTTKKPGSKLANKGSKTTKKPTWKWKPSNKGSNTTTNPKLKGPIPIHELIKQLALISKNKTATEDQIESQVFTHLAKSFDLAKSDTHSTKGKPCVEVLDDCNTDDDCCGKEIICKRHLCRPKAYVPINVMD